jgi:xylulokinase
VSLLGIDIGSSSCKAAVFSTEGRTLASAVSAYAPVISAPSMAEIDPDVFWHAVVRVVRESSAAAPDDPVQALCIGVHGETFIPTDAAGEPVGRAVMNIDNRAVEEAAWWERMFGRDRLYRITGQPPHPMYPAAKLRWLQHHRPDLVGATARFLGPSEYVLLRMGLPPVTDYSLASRWQAFDILAHRWSSDILAAAGIPESRLPEAVPAGTLAGRLAPAAARELGLPAGTAVAVGGHDQPCASLGCGAVEPGIVSDSAGTYECLTCASSAPCLGPVAMQASLNSYCHVVPDRYATLAFFPSGIMVRWFLERLAAAESERAASQGLDPHAWFEARMPEGPTGLCVTPHLIGACNPHWNPRASAAVVGLTPSSDVFQLYRGVLEGIACEFALETTTLEKATAPFSRVRIAGGGAGSALGLRLRAALSGRTVETLRNPEAVCLGAAILGGVAAGVFHDVHDGVAHAVGVADEQPPEPGLAAAYADQLARYNLLYPSLAPLFNT